MMLFLSSLYLEKLTGPVGFALNFATIFMDSLAVVKRADFLRSGEACYHINPVCERNVGSDQALLSSGMSAFLTSNSKSFISRYVSKNFLTDYPPLNILTRQ